MWGQPPRLSGGAQPRCHRAAAAWDRQVSLHERRYALCRQRVRELISRHAHCALLRHRGRRRRQIGSHRGDVLILDSERLVHTARVHVDGYDHKVAATFVRRNEDTLRIVKGRVAANVARPNEP